MINHLLFHKALIDEDSDSSSINQYLNLIKMASQGENLSISNPFDRSIYLAFELVLNEKMNPWDLDLVSFSTMYIRRAKEEKIDLLSAGRIIYMAWKVLKMQSDNLVVNMESKKEQENFAFGWEDIPTGTWYENDDGYSYTNLVMKMPTPPLEEPLRRESSRKITLIELLDAFNVARKEAEQYQIVDKLRKEEREKLAFMARKSMKGAAHEDHLEEDIAIVWDKIKQYPKKSMSIKQICNSSDPEDRIKTFLSVLFLAYDNKIIIFQKKFPYGEIFIKNLKYT